MNAQFKATNPDDMVFEATFTLKLRDWRMMLETDQLKAGMWPSCDFREVVRSMVSQAERTYYPEVVEK